MKKLRWMLRYLMALPVFLMLFQIPAAASERVYISGEPVGIYIRTKGLLVLGTADVQGIDGSDHPSRDRLLPGDYIQKVNDDVIATGRELTSFLNKNGKKDIVFTVLRKGKKQKIRITPIYVPKERSFKIGAWIRNDTQGIGTVTFTLPDGRFAALGHGINDYDLGVPMSIAGGSIYKARIHSVIKGQEKHPGQIMGSIDYKSDQYMGSVDRNSSEGISGRLTKGCYQGHDKKTALIASAGEIKKGKAFLRTSISGQSRDYTVEIEKIERTDNHFGKKLKIHVTDRRLLALTGGIIQGLSGSPIIQDGKLAGAVTHVLVDDPTRGYGIFAEDMLKNVK